MKELKRLKICAVAGADRVPGIPQAAMEEFAGSGAAPAKTENADRKPECAGRAEGPPLAIPDVWCRNPGIERALPESLVALQFASGKPCTLSQPIKSAMQKNLVIRCLPAFLLGAALLKAEPAMEKQTDGVIFALDGAFLKIEVRADNIIRVAYAKDRAFFTRPSLVVEPARGPAASWELKTGPGEAIVATAKVRARVDLSTGAIAFFDPAGRPVLAEQSGGRALTPAEVQGTQTWHARQQWAPDADESLYGLGENQLGLVDIKGYDLDFWQHNGTVAIPFLVSSRGYGLLWDNPSFTRFGDLRPFDPIPGARLFDADGKPGGLTGTYFADGRFEKQVARQTDARIEISSAHLLPSNTAIQPNLPAHGDISVRWEGSVEAETTGDHQFQTYSDCNLKIWVDDHLVVNHWRQGWLPWYDLVRVRLEAGRRHRLRLDWVKDDNPPVLQLRWKTPAADSATSLWSEVADGIDYYFVYGPEVDQVIAGYRRLTGPAPMMPQWVFGLWQSRQRYKTAQESLDVVKGFRSRGIPFDNIVQDWFYWKKEAWGSHEFDPARFPDPEGWIQALHEQHARLMISVWPKFYPGTKNFEAMRQRGFLYERNLKENVHDWVGFVSTFYDAFNPEARKLFWSQAERELFRKHVDAWWLDATEPDLTPRPTVDTQRDYMNPTALGPGSRVLNAFPLENAEAVYNGQRAAAPDQRVFILTRSGFAGQQRYAAAVWSGDSSSTWTALRLQVQAGLSFCLSGMPYWTMDVGGFAVPKRFATPLGLDKDGDPIHGTAVPADVEDWRELNTRWFQFGAFTPLLRTHGEYPYREMWEFGGESSPAYQAQLKFDRLRYRLLPYIYSLAGAVTQEGGTMMRALVMDFRSDARARRIGDEYMFGPAFLVNPVTEPRARTRPVYLPEAAGWTDFWTGAAMAGGQTIEAPAPYDAIPLFVRAGAIVPFGPELQYTSEKPADPVTLFVYAGADGAFTFYEDDGLTYGYERGAWARIPIRWNDAARTLTIGRREGSFPGMLGERTFQVVVVSKTRPVGFSFAPAVDQAVRYRGESIEIQIP
jgi:alpha-D-xyloside xylohydrolase